MCQSGKPDILIGMSANEERDLLVTVSWMLNRQVRMKEMLSALGMSSSTFYEQKEKGVLNSLDNLMTVADYFGLDKVALQVLFGHLTKDELITYLEREGEVVADDEETLDPPKATILKVVRRQKPRTTNKPKARTDIPPL
ncbi:transcriptional repressor [Mycobacterium phage Bromden]|uniref:Immunity repressor n=1 Tax=Mycobacterium phage Bromden TaxID=2283252 RepID=A0A345MBH4_9CAUD|nr:transcriptional repressor [Mycobacterium phage Bromden]AXH67845.1 immunity repressor [Mycobacterium phage Bromden]